MKPFLIHAEARAELEEAVAHYEAQRRGLGRDFHKVFERAVDLIRQNPEIGAIYKETSYRYFTLRRFPYVIYYLELREHISIAAVAHGRRRPDYWRRRRVE
jgi:toxin ParE1/3/4